MSETADRREIATAWAPYIAIIVTIVVTVGGAAWSTGAGQVQLGAKIEAVEEAVEAKIEAVEAKIEAVEAKVEANADAIRAVLAAVEENRQAIAANSAKIERLDGRLDEHRRVHAEARAPARTGSGAGN